MRRWTVPLLALLLSLPPLLLVLTLLLVYGQLDGPLFDQTQQTLDPRITEIAEAARGFFQGYLGTLMAFFVTGLGLFYAVLRRDGWPLYWGLLMGPTLYHVPDLLRLLDIGSRLWRS